LILWLIIKRAFVMEIDICAGRKTVKTVSDSGASLFTAINRGVNEKAELTLLVFILFTQMQLAIKFTRQALIKEFISGWPKRAGSVTPACRKGTI
jgi:hypothetical protein